MNSSLLNDSNNPYATTEAQFDAYVNQYILYIVVGAFSGAANILMITVILTRKELREKYLAQSVLALGDFCDSFAHVVAGSVRLTYLYSDTFNIPMTPLHCMLYPFNPAFVLTALLTGVSTMIISTERFVCVFRPTFYFQSPIKLYSAISCAIGVGFSAVSVLFAYFVAYNRQVMITSSCITSVTVGDQYSLFYYGTNVATFGVAIILYISTTIITCRSSRNGSKDISDKQTAARMARQAKITKMMGAVFANIFLLQFVQNLIIVVAISIGGVTQSWYTKTVGYFTLLMDASGPLNALTYVYFNEEMRNGFKDVLLLRCGKNRVHPMSHSMNGTQSLHISTAKHDVDLL